MIPSTAKIAASNTVAEYDHEDKLFKAYLAVADHLDSDEGEDAVVVQADMYIGRYMDAMQEILEAAMATPQDN